MARGGRRELHGRNADEKLPIKYATSALGRLTEERQSPIEIADVEVRGSSSWTYVCSSRPAGLCLCPLVRGRLRTSYYDYY